MAQLEELLNELLDRMETSDPIQPLSTLNASVQESNASLNGIQTQLQAILRGMNVLEARADADPEPAPVLEIETPAVNFGLEQVLTDYQQELQTLINQIEAFTKTVGELKPNPTNQLDAAARDEQSLQVPIELDTTTLSTELDRLQSLIADRLSLTPFLAQLDTLKNVLQTIRLENIPLDVTQLNTTLETLQAIQRVDLPNIRELQQEMEALNLDTSVPIQQLTDLQQALSALSIPALNVRLNTEPVLNQLEALQTQFNNLQAPVVEPLLPAASETPALPPLPAIEQPIIQAINPPMVTIQGSENDSDTLQTEIISFKQEVAAHTAILTRLEQTLSNLTLPAPTLSESPTEPLMRVGNPTPTTNPNAKVETLLTALLDSVQALSSKQSQLLLEVKKNNFLKNTEDF